MGELYQAVAEALRAVVAPAAGEAWQTQPVASAAAMNIGDLGVDQAQVAALATRVALVAVQVWLEESAAKPERAAEVFSAPVRSPHED